jgi:hypothetical protein
MATVYRLAKNVSALHFGLTVIAVVAFAVLWNFVLCHRPVDITSSGVAAWWTGLCAVSILNICGWHLSAAALARRKATVEPSIHTLQKWLLLLSAIYVLGCGFRSVLPRADVQRIGLFDSWVSSVLVGRSVATVAELCFAAQWALLLHKFAKDAQAGFALLISRLLVPLIAAAELCSWYAVLTTCYLGNVLEESIWALSASLLVISALTLWSHTRVVCRPFLAAGLALGVGYVAFMLTVDIPMYWSRWLIDEANGREYLSFVQGIRDICLRWNVTFAWEDWRTEIPWMSLYFSVCVWCSIALVHAPILNLRRRSTHKMVMPADRVLVAD